VKANGIAHPLPAQTPQQEGGKASGFFLHATGAEPSTDSLPKKPALKMV